MRMRMRMMGTMALAGMLALSACEGASRSQGGDQRPCDLGHTVLAWTRGDAFLAAVNFAAEPVEVELPDGARSVLSTDPDRPPDALPHTLHPNEGVLLRLPS